MGLDGVELIGVAILGKGGVQGRIVVTEVEDPTGEA